MNKKNKLKPSFRRDFSHFLSYVISSITADLPNKWKRYESWTVFIQEKELLLVSKDVLIEHALTQTLGISSEMVHQGVGQG